jgi:glycerol-3-phosphate O-acyltransferase
LLAERRAPRAEDVDAAARGLDIRRVKFFDRLAAKSVLRSRARVDRFKLAGRAFVREQLLGDRVIADAVEEHARDAGVTREAAWKKVDSYINEIVPFFNIIAYFRFGYATGKALLNLFYKVSVEYEDRAALTRLPRSSIVV